MKVLRLACAAAASLLFGSAAVVQAAPAPPAGPHSATHPNAAPIVPNGSWPVYHHDNAHTGFDSTQPAASGGSTGWVSGTMDAQVYASPLVHGGIVYAATLNNTVYAFNQSDGSTLWSNHLLAPTTSGWLCGNVSPMGILGTPIIDTAAGRIYVAALGFDHIYYVYGLALTTGAVVLTTAIGSGIGTGFDWTTQQQRGALGLANGYVYVPFGGRAGDCGAYHGWVVAVPTSGSTTPAVWQTASNAAGIWAPGGVVVDDATNNVFFPTGNAIPCGGSTYSDSIVRTNGSLGTTSSFQPVDWSANWCGPDLDLGSASPTIISPTLAFTSGKYGQGFLLNPTNLGGLNGQVFPAPSPYVGADVCVGNHSNATFGSFAYAAPYVYLSCEGQGMVGLRVDTVARTFSLCDATCAAPSWNSGAGKVYGPPIVAGGIVWAVDTNGSGLTGFDAATGASVFQSGAFGVHRFSTPSEAGGQVFVASDLVVRSFNLVNGCSSVTLSAAPPTSAQSGTTVVLTATATGPNCVSPQYRFWMRPAAGSWTMLADYSGTNTYSWTSTTPAGSYYLGVHARHLGSTAAYESLASIPYTLTTAKCTAVTLSAAPASPKPSGTPVTFTASSTCPNANPMYEFWARWQGYSDWQLLKSYSTSNVYNWNSTGAAAGTEYFGVWVRDAGSSTSGFDANFSIPYSVTTPSCASVTVSAVPNPVVHGTGTHVTITGAASGCTNLNPRYEFWMRPAWVTDWQLVQGYSTSATYDWNSTGAPAGTIYFGVWAKDAGSPTASFDANVSTPVTVT